MLEPSGHGVFSVRLCRNSSVRRDLNSVWARRKIRPQGNSELTFCLHGQSFLSFHSWVELRFQLPTPTSINCFIGIRTRLESSWHLKIWQPLSAANTDILALCTALSIVPHDLGHDLTPIPYKISGFHSSGVFTPLDHVPLCFRQPRSKFHCGTTYHRHS
jgi:hypothetical protein